MRRLSLLAFLLLIPCASSIRGQEDKRQHPYRYLIPKGYVGWVRIDFNVKDASAPLVEDGYYLFRIPATGRLQTSLGDELGILKDQYFYVCDEKRSRLSTDHGRGLAMIWGNFMGNAFLSNGLPYKYRYFFVGPKEEYLKYEYGGANRDNIELEEDGFPKVNTKNSLPCEKS